jgi:hypothetical protein
VRSRSVVRIAAVTALAIGMLAAPAVSQAHKKTFGTTVTATAPNKNKVTGSVKSGKAKCLAQRRVGIYSAAGALEATAVTDAQGAFSVNDKNLTAGTHDVRVGKRVLVKNSKHTHVCRGTTNSLVVS